MPSAPGFTAMRVRSLLVMVAPCVDSGLEVIVIEMCIRDSSEAVSTTDFSVMRLWPITFHSAAWMR